MPARSFVLRGISTALVALAVAVVPALAEELSGTIKSVDVDAKKIVVTATEGGRDVEITVNNQTVAENAKGKVLKKFNLKRLKTAGKVDVTHENGVASKIVLKKGALKKGTPKKKGE